MPLGVGRCESLGARLDPDLEKMGGFAARGIEFRVSDAGASTHELDLAGAKLATISHAVLVFQYTGDDVSENFHIAVRVSGKSTTGGHVIFIDDPQTAEAHLRWIMVIGEAESVMTVEPTVMGMPTG